jgi:hypothetical protein
MIPVGFVGSSFNLNYFIEYLNVVFTDDIDEPWDHTNFIDGYKLFFKDLDLEVGKDIYIFNTDQIMDGYKEFEPNNYLIGIPITNFPIELSIKRMCMDTYALLESIDFIVEEPLEVIEFMIFNMR